MPKTTSEKLIRFSVLFILAGFCGGSTPFSHEAPRGIIVLEPDGLPRSQKEALLILPGFGSKDEGVEDVRNYFSHRGYDLFIPDYVGRDSLAECVTNLDRFIQGEELLEYKRLHVVAYIIGGWTLNRWIQQHPQNNIATVVYDRSPLQERAAYAAVHDMPLLTRLARGRIVEEFSKTPYSPIPNDEKNIGIIMECRATKLVREHLKTVLSLGKVDWGVPGRNQDCDDYFYSLNNHDEMYHNFSVAGPQILYFLRNGRFTENAPRTRPDIDPFGKEEPQGASRKQPRATSLAKRRSNW